MSEPNTSIWITLKNMSYVMAFFAYLHVSTETTLILIILMFLDTLTGIFRTGVVHGGRTITSHNLSVGVMKKVCFLLVPVVLALAGKGVGLDLTHIVEWAFTALILSETYSIVSNIYSIHIRKDVQEFDGVSYIMQTLLSVLERIIRKTPK
jgi:phage-related holin